jgi:hypothetical protein
MGIALILAFAAIFIWEKTASQPGTKQAKAFISGLNMENFGEIRITGKNDAVRIFRKAGTWMVSEINTAIPAGNGETGGVPDQIGDPLNQTAASGTSIAEYPADTASVGAALTKLSSMKKQLHVSRNPDNQETFEVDSVKGLLVEVLDLKGTSRGGFRLGKSGPDYSSNYIRSMGSDDVWVVGGGIKGSLFTELKRWRDKSMVTFDSASIKQLIISTKDSVTKKVSTMKFSVSRDSLNNKVWTITEPVQSLAKSKDINNIISQFSSLKTADWENDTTVADSITGFSSPSATVTAILQNGDSKTAVFGKKQQYGGKIYAKADGKKEIFLINETSMRVFQKKPEELKEDPQPVIGPETATE